MSDVFGVSSAWRGLERIVKSDFIDEIGDLKTIVEIGVDWGYSFYTFATLFPNAKVYGFDNDSYHPSGYSFVESHLNEFKNASLHKLESADGVSWWKENNMPEVDVLHIDADHSFNGVKRDFDLWSPLVRKNGVILFHDIESFRDDVGRFFYETLSGKKKFTTQHCGLGAWYNEK